MNYTQPQEVPFFMVKDGEVFVLDNVAHIKTSNRTADKVVGEKEGVNVYQRVYIKTRTKVLTHPSIVLAY